MASGSISYKCPACGASIAYNTETQDFFCEYCGSHFADASQLDPPLDGGEAVEAPPDEFGERNRLYLCPSCGAAVITDSELSASAECYYCHSPVVLSGRLSGEYRPDLIIPFKKTREQAIEGFKQWTQKKKTFLAKGFGSEESLSKMQAIYIPFWLADCTVDADIRANCFKMIGSVRQGDYIIFTKEKSEAVRSGTVTYSMVPADASTRADDELMDSIEPYDYKDFAAFDMSYLSGHSAIRYDVSREQVRDRIKVRVEGDTEDFFKKEIKGYTRVDIVKRDIKINDFQWKHAMLPVWFMTYFYKDKMYYYAMNGQTGKFGGRLPINKAKVAAFSLIPLGVGILLALIFSLKELFLW